MNKSTDIVTKTTPLHKLKTWQSGVLLSTMHRNVKRITDSYLDSYDLTTMHWFIIGTILDSSENGIRITDLSEKVGTTLGYLTNAVNNLELKGMVSRTDHRTDSRTKLLTIPEPFRTLCDAIESGLREELRQNVYKNISRDELSTFITVLQKLS